jgi:hypothetical protein
VVWEKVKSVLANPELLLNEVRKQTEAEQQQVSAGDSRPRNKSIKS